MCHTEVFRTRCPICLEMFKNLEFDQVTCDLGLKRGGRGRCAEPGEIGISIGPTKQLYEVCGKGQCQQGAQKLSDEGASRRRGAQEGTNLLMEP